MLSSCNLFGDQYDIERLKEPPTFGRPVSPEFIMAKPDLFWNQGLYVRGYIHYSGDDLNIARLMPSREMFLAPPPEDNSLWLHTREGIDLRGCHGKYVEVLGVIEIEELKETGSDRIYALKPILDVDSFPEWFGEIPSAFEDPVPDPSEFETVKAERLALQQIDDRMTCVTFTDLKTTE